MVRHWYFALICFVANLALGESLPACQIGTDRWMYDSPPTACFAGYGELQKQAPTGEVSSDSQARYLGRFYASSGLGRLISLHSQASIKQEGSAIKTISLADLRGELAFLQLGHPLSGPLYASIGRISAPLGINRDLFEYSHPSRAQEFWAKYLKGASLGTKLGDESQIEFGALKSSPELKTDWNNESFMVGRIIQAIDLLSGTKLVASYGSRLNNQDRRLGIATIVHGDQSILSFEWMRRYQPEYFSDFGQVFRLCHEQQETNWAWAMAWEDIRHDSFRLSFKASRPAYKYLVSSATVHWSRLFESGKNELSIILALGIGRAWTWEGKEP